MPYKSKDNEKRRQAMRYGGNDPKIGMNGYKYGANNSIFPSTCCECGKVTLTTRESKKYCSLQCSGRHHTKRKLETARGRLHNAMKARLNKAVRRKAGRTVEYLGCSIEEFIEYMVHHYAWKPWFTLENYGEVWHIDHIRPLASFSDDELERGFHYTNCQPLAASDNLRKNSKWNGKTWRKHDRA